MPAANVFPGAARWAGIPIPVAGLWLTVAADAQFKRVRTAINPFGRPSVLVRDGPFRLSRNPMYLGLGLALLGVALLLGSLAALAVPPLFAGLLTARFIVREERTMAEQFGTEYEAYRRRVRRWV